MLSISEKDGSVIFKVRVQPRASLSELAGEHAGALKLRLAAPPVDGKANDECRRFLAKLFAVAPSSVEILAGETSRDKLIKVHGVDLARARAALSK